MKPWPKYLITLAALAGLALAATVAARAETWNLELKRLSGSRTALGSSADFFYRYTYPQYFSSQVGPVDKSRMVFSAAKEQEAAFKRLVQKEPKYASEYPFRGVAKLGSQEFAFVLDAVPAKSSSQEEKSGGKQAKPADEAKKAEGGSAKPEGKETKSDCAEAKAKDEESADVPLSQAIKYNRLYFDLNHNGDLTDDKVIVEEASRIVYPSSSSYVHFEFPRVDVTIDVDGTKLDYAFLLSGYVNASRDYTYAGISLNAAAYREGDIELEGKKRHVVLLDFNSNGRFDDVLKLRTNIITPDGRLYPEQGDMLLIDPSLANSGSPYDVTSSNYRHHVSKLVNIDGHYYDLAISPAGDKLTLNPSSVPLGSVSNPNDGFRALLYGDQGVVTISGGPDMPVPLPEGQWRLLSYTIDDRTGRTEPSDSSAEKKTGTMKKEEAEKPSLLSALSKALGGAAAASLPAMRTGGPTLISAYGTKACPAIEVRKGETVALPFGPPYTPVVKMDYQHGAQAELGMSLVGAAGEVCTSLMVNGRQPAKPEFTITDPAGEVVERGSFEYG